MYILLLGMRQGLKIGFFHRGWEMEVEALIRNNTVVWGELGIIISAGQSNWEAF